MTPSVLAVNKTATATYDFTTAANRALSSIQADLGSGIFGMYGGNVNGDNTVRASGPLSINDYLKIINAIGSSAVIVTQPF